MSAEISVVYLTHRVDPRFEWFAEAFAAGLGDEAVEVIVVDGVYSLERTAVFAAIVRGRFPFRHVPAKPTPYAGAFRRTSRNFFSAASARNTGIIHATAPYIVFVDDLSVPMPGWWDEARAGARAEQLVAGAYQKHFEMVVDNGVLVSSRSEPHGYDSRWGQGSDTGLTTIGGSQLFGSSVGVPRDLLLEVNGFDEICDSIGGEDWHFGVRIEWTGQPIFYSRRMLTIESEELHHVGPPARRLDKTAPPSVYLRRLREFGVPHRQFEGHWDSSHMMLDILFGTRTTQTQGNYYLLSSLHPDTLEDIVARFPRYHWFDGQPLGEL